MGVSSGASPEAEGPDPGSETGWRAVTAVHWCVTTTSAERGKPSGRAWTLEPIWNLSASSRVRATRPAIRNFVPLGVNSSPKTTCVVNLPPSMFATGA